MRRGTAGMTLAEVLVALALLAFVALGVVSFLGVSMKQNQLSQQRSVATGLAAGRLEQLTSLPFKVSADVAEYAIAGETLTTGPPATLAMAEGQIPGYPEYSRTVSLTYDTPVVGMLAIGVEVAWQPIIGPRRSHSLITYVHPQLEEVQ